MGDIPWPFRSTEMLSTGAVTEHYIRTRYRQLYPGICVPREVEVSATQRAYSAWLWTGRRGVIAGLAASAVHGAKWVEAGVVVDLIHRHHKTARGLRIHRDTLMDNEIDRIEGIAVTSPARTAFDVGRWLPQAGAVERIDALMAATGLLTEQVEDVMKKHKGVRGLARLRSVLALVDGGSESPQETRTRLALSEIGFSAATDANTGVQSLRRFHRPYRHGLGGLEGRCRIRWSSTLVGRPPTIARHRSGLGVGGAGLGHRTGECRDAAAPRGHGGRPC